MGLKPVLRLARERFEIFAVIVGGAQARLLALLFYFTVLVPFALLMRLSADPLERHTCPRWQKRAPVPQALDAAHRQG